MVWDGLRKHYMKGDDETSRERREWHAQKLGLIEFNDLMEVQHALRFAILSIRSQSNYRAIQRKSRWKNLLSIRVYNFWECTNFLHQYTEIFPKSLCRDPSLNGRYLQRVRSYTQEHWFRAIHCVVLTTWSVVQHLARQEPKRNKDVFDERNRSRKPPSAWIKQATDPNLFMIKNWYEIGMKLLLVGALNSI